MNDSLLLSRAILVELIPKLLAMKKCPNPQSIDKYSRIVLMAAELRRIADETIHIQLQNQKSFIGSKLENRQVFVCLGVSPKNRMILDEQLKKIQISLQQQLHSLNASLAFSYFCRESLQRDHTEDLLVRSFLISSGRYPRWSLDWRPFLGRMRSSYTR